MRDYSFKSNSKLKQNYLIAKPANSRYVQNPHSVYITPNPFSFLLRHSKKEAKKQFKKWVKQTLHITANTQSPQTHHHHHTHQCAIIIFFNKTNKWWSPQTCSPWCTSTTVSHPAPPPPTPWSADHPRLPPPPASPAPRSSSATKRIPLTMASPPFPFP